MNRKQRRYFKVCLKPTQDWRGKAVNPLERAALNALTQRKKEQACRFVEKELGRYPQFLTPGQVAGPYTEPYTARLLAEIECGGISVRAIAKMKRTEDDFMRLGGVAV